MHESVKRIEKQRVKLGMSIREATTKANISYWTWYRIVNGGTVNPGIGTIDAMQRAVGLIDDTDAEAPNQ